MFYRYILGIMQEFQNTLCFCSCIEIEGVGCFEYQLAAERFLEKL